MEITILKLAVCLLVHSYVLSAVHSRFVQNDLSPQTPTPNIDDVLSGLLDEEKLDELHNNPSQTETPQEETAEEDSSPSSIFPRFKRSPSPCVLKRIKKWNHCLGRRFTEIHCRKQSVACLSPENVPPKCNKIYTLFQGKNRYCPVVTGCECAA